MKIEEIFGSLVFNDKVMSERLQKSSYLKMMKVVAGEDQLTLSLANEVACAMKDWAIENGATHFTHWFQPMTGITAEKHDSFIDVDKNGGVITDFSGKSLIKGESDASSFPSGGLRATFEARGYTAWDPTSYAFIKENCLCIPTAFCSYDGSSLDKKSPLLRSLEVINKEGLRILRLFGNKTAKKVIVNVGAEQEYFLIDKKVANKRLDLTLCGRTLFGTKPPKGQELDDHYYGSINSRVQAFMTDLDIELWKHGIYAKTEHNEAAPAQHELAPIYEDANLATDHNQLTMEYMKSVAQKHDMYCLLHEKPFYGINGSGKHNNWSLSTDDGVNLFLPGNTPHDNAQFLLFLTATITAIDEYQDILRASVASASNDLRLGANEAPPAIISIFLGDELTDVLKAIETGTDYVGGESKEVEIGVTTLPKFKKDTTDRNRTSPIAFTGDKFEFRALGSSASVATPNIVLNTIVADVLSRFATRLENATDFKGELTEIIRSNIKEHKRILFNGNSYSNDWVNEAKSRGLSNLKTSVDAFPAIISEESIKLFTKHGVFSHAELLSRCDIMLENYYKIISIEANTMIEMAKKEILPASLKYQDFLCDLITKKTDLDINCRLEKETLAVLAKDTDCMQKAISKLCEALKNANVSIVYESAKYCCNIIIPIMDELRLYADKLELNVSKEYWPFPTYSDILYSVK